MKKALVGLLFLLIAGIALLGSTFLPQQLEVPAGKSHKLQQNELGAGITLKAIPTGSISSTTAFAYRGGSFLEPMKVSVGSILIQHPKGNLLVDAGLGKSLEKHLATTPWLMRTLSKIEEGIPAATQLASQNIELSGILLTHAHWDHVSGIENFPDTPVLVTEQELRFVNSRNPAAQLAKELIRENAKVYGFADKSYMGFQKSYDYFGDGSVIVVPAPGHTPGSVIVFVNTSDGKHYALIGDIAWRIEGVRLPAEKPWLARRMVDANAKNVRRQLVDLNRLKRNNPDLIIVPAHDINIWNKLPKLEN